jgi:hypothetical protein
MSVGVGLGAIVLHFTVILRGGDTLAAGDFVNAFAIVAAVSATSCLMFRRLAPDAGAELIGARFSGSKRQPRNQPS